MIVLMRLQLPFITLFANLPMKILARLFHLNKRQKFVIGVVVLSAGVFVSEMFQGNVLFISALVLSIATDAFLLWILRKDIQGSYFYPILILPFFYTLAFPFFYTLVPTRLISRLIITCLYAFGLYSLFLTQNIFAVSGIRTINLLRSARIVSFVITILVFYFLVNFIFSMRLPVYFTPLAILPVIFLMNIQSLWSYSLDQKQVGEIVVFSSMISLALMELSYVLIIWPVTASIYSLFLTGIFYTYSGLSHAWLERRLFKGILWEYVWVGFISMLFLIIFAKWGA